MTAIVRSHKALRITEESVRDFEDTVVVETPLTLYVNDEEFVTLVCTPEFLDELVVGFIASEGLIRTFEDIRSLAVDATRGMAWVALQTQNELQRRMFGKRVFSSCCGRGRTSFYFFNDTRTARPVEAEWTVPRSVCFETMAALQSQSHAFHVTGGIHNAALADLSGRLVAVRSDIGRHNALDKLYGWALHHRLDLGKTMAVFSGRVSSEVLLKIAKMGVPLLLSKSAPTDLGLNMAEDLGITVVGFLRARTMNVYTHPRRIAQ
ncbi:MAG: formate dehydrogenase accessory sulfurtransferase FdhD [Kyrpidia sp.]|nr:formate dehydrogenase accessory sulfurtransferase FdhD [Kyrpidia sp.]